MRSRVPVDGHYESTAGTLMRTRFAGDTVSMLNQTKLLNIISGKQKGLVAGAVRLGLGCLTPIYRTAMYWRNRKFDRAIHDDGQGIIKRASIPVISVGNLTTGGTGKTPFVIWIAKYLQDRSLRVVLISRGYGLKKSERIAVPNDEALEMERRLDDVPHLQDPDRFRMVQIAEQEHDSEIIVLDDAFQHRRLHRDLDLVLIDATAPFGFNRLLPRGLLREPLSSLRRADAVVLTRADLVDDNKREAIIKRIREENGSALIAQTQTTMTGLIQFDGHQEALSKVAHKSIYVFCGIGNPDSFIATINQLQCDIAGSSVFPDHHHYQHYDLDRIGQSAVDLGATAILCTHKDLVKIGFSRLAGVPLYAVLIDIKFQSGKKGIEQMLDRLAQSISTNG